MKNLFVMAHMGEAKSFITHFKMKKIPFLFDGVYESEDFYLLLTKEGLQNSSERSMAFITFFNDKIDKVYNIGICGALKGQKTHSIHQIRTIYCDRNKSVEFKSFTSSLANSTIDLISSNKRVFEKDYSQYLKNFAPLVDREAWSIASTCQLLKKKFLAIKMISDQGGDEKKEICEIVKDQAEFFSSSLLAYFLENISLDLEDEKQEKDDLPILESFHLTTTQRRFFSSLKEKLERKHKSKLEKIINIEKFISSKKLPKDRSKDLLMEMERALNPVKFQFVEKIESITKEHTDEFLSIQFDRSLEREGIKISAHINSERKLEDLKKKLSKIPLAKVLKAQNGDLNVQ